MLVRFEVLCTETVLCLGAAIFLRNGWWSLFSLKVCSSVDLVFVLIESFLFHCSCSKFVVSQSLMRACKIAYESALIKIDQLQ